MSRCDVEGLQMCVCVSLSHCINQILESISHIHQHDIVHRDLKVSYLLREGLFFGCLTSYLFLFCLIFLFLLQTGMKEVCCRSKRTACADVIL